MQWRERDDEYRIPGDIPGTRRALLTVATKFYVYFLFLVALGGAAIFIAGVIGLILDDEVGAKAEEIPEPIVLMVVGMISFSLFFPSFTAVYFGRHFLRSVMRLEDEVARLKAATGSQATDDEGRTP